MVLCYSSSRKLTRLLSKQVVAQVESISSQGCRWEPPRLVGLPLFCVPGTARNGTHLLCNSPLLMYVLHCPLRPRLQKMVSKTEFLRISSGDSKVLNQAQGPSQHGPMQLHRSHICEWAPVKKRFIFYLFLFWSSVFLVLLLWLRKVRQACFINALGFEFRLPSAAFLFLLSVSQT